MGSKPAVMVAGVAALALLAFGSPATAGGKPNQADINHPNIHQKVGGGQDGARRNANPNGSNERGGGLHGIGNNPGQSGADPSDGAPGFADQLTTVHGGIDDVNKNAIP